MRISGLFNAGRARPRAAAPGPESALESNDAIALLPVRREPKLPAPPPPRQPSSEVLPRLRAKRARWRLPFLSAPRPLGVTALAEAAARGDAVALRRALDAGDDANMPTPCGRTPLHWAASSHLDCTEALMELVQRPGRALSGADVHARTPQLRIDAHNVLGGETALHTLVLCGDAPAAGVHFLVDCGADVNACAANGASPLWAAALWRLNTDARWTLPLFTQDTDRMGPLVPEAVPGDTPDALEAMEALLACGADPNQRWRGYTLAEILCKWFAWRQQTLALLLRHGAAIPPIRGVASVAEAPNSARRGLAGPDPARGVSNLPCPR